MEIHDDDIVEATFRNNYHPRTPLEFNMQPAGRERTNWYLLPGSKYALPGYVYKHIMGLHYPIYGEVDVPEKQQKISMKVGEDPRFSFTIHNITKHDAEVKASVAPEVKLPSPPVSEAIEEAGAVPEEVVNPVPVVKRGRGRPKKEKK